MILRAVKQPVLCPGTGIDDLRAGLHGQRVQSGLLHDADDVAEERGLGDPAGIDPVELAVWDQRDLAGWRDAEPGAVEQAHELAHAGDPQRTVYPVPARHEDVLSALQGGERLAHRPPDGRAYFVETG